MADPDNYKNIYVDLASGAYANTTKGRSFVDKTYAQLEELRTKGYATYKFEDGLAPYYLQDDKLEVVKEWFGTKEYKKGLLTDEKAGYNSYYLTDTPTLNKDTKRTYFTTRGSDGIALDTLNDWVDNNTTFALKNAYIPQAKLATKAMHEKINELRIKAPNAKMTVTGHSLGTMVSIQAVANLPKEDIAKLDKIVLFQGPDARESINKMSSQARANIQTLEEQGKIEYYVNAFDIVSMLNRNHSDVDEIGKVHYLLPKSFTTTFDFEDKHGSSHDFGQYQINADGTLKEANLKEHSYIFRAGIKVSNLVDKYKKWFVIGNVVGLLLVNPAIVFGGDFLLYKKFEKDYQDIIDEAKEASQWQGKVATLKQNLTAASGVQRIELREELTRMVAQKAQSIGEEYDAILQNKQQELEEEIANITQEIASGAYELRKTLSVAEVDEMIALFTKERFWDAEQASKNYQQAKSYHDKMDDFRGNLLKVAKNIQDYDRGQGRQLFNE